MTRAVSTGLAGSAATFLLLTLTAGCAGGEKVDTAALPRLVLQNDHVPDLQLFDEGRQARTDLPPGERSDPDRFGRQGGWKARFRHPGASAGTEGPLVVESRADVFAEAEGAEKDLAAARSELERAWEPVHAPEIGDEAWAATTVQEAVAADVRYFTIVWRDANVVASILVQGFDDRIDVDDAVALARKQQEQIEAAEDS